MNNIKDAVNLSWKMKGGSFEKIMFYFVAKKVEKLGGAKYNVYICMLELFNNKYHI